MVIKIPVTQVPDMWEIIKLAAVKSDNVSDEDMQNYCNGLLIKLLSGKLFAVVKLSPEREVTVLMLMEYSVSAITELKTLHLTNVYSWRNNTEQDWMEYFEIGCQFAREEKCEFIDFISYNKRIWELATSAGFNEACRTYVFPL